MLHYNKVYQSLKKVTADWHAGIPQWHYYWYCIKFFDDNNLIYAQTRSDNVEEINKWFDKASLHVTKGVFRYDVSKGALKLEFTGVELNAVITFENNILLEGKLSWDMFHLII